MPGGPSGAAFSHLARTRQNPASFWREGLATLCVERENEETQMKKPTRNIIKWNREDEGQTGRRQPVFA